jgi:Cu/Ag efflux pump CusA
MLIYLDQALVEVKRQLETEGLSFAGADLIVAIMLGAVVRPKIMALMAIIAGLVPIL